MANLKSDRKINRKVVILTIIIVILLVSCIFLLLSSIEINGEAQYPPQQFISFDNSTLVSIRMPAIDADGNGALTYLTVEATPGTGRILVDIDNLLFWDDTQQSMRTARSVAANITGKNIQDYDLIYNIHAQASTVGGPSAGAALTMATIAALEAREINNSVMITGTINHDGSIGPAGSILEKAKAARQANATLFLVPLLQSRDVTYEETEICEKFGWTDICSTENIPQKIDIQKETGLRVIEIGSIQEAMAYMLK
jgi:uncharacterized protein